MERKQSQPTAEEGEIFISQFKAYDLAAFPLPYCSSFVPFFIRNFHVKCFIDY